MATRLWHVPLRLAAGAFLLDQGMSKLGLDDEQVKQLQGSMAGVFPQLADMDSRDFAQLVTVSELGLGGALLGMGVVPSGVAGLGLAGFGAAMLRLSLQAPAAGQEQRPRSTPQAVAAAKDTWLLAIGSALVLDALFGPRRRRRGRRRGRRRRS